jgi:hypothetical protein
VWFVCVLFVCVAAAVLLPCDRRSPLLLPRAALALLQAAPFQQFGDDEGAVGRGRDVQRGGGQERVGDILRAARSVSALDEETADVDANGSHQDFSLRHSVGSLSRYQKEHPEFVTSVFTWFLLGNIFFAIGLIMVLFSEIKAVLICRDQDFRISLHARGYMKPASADAPTRLPDCGGYADDVHRPFMYHYPAVRHSRHCGTSGVAVLLARHLWSFLRRLCNYVPVAGGGVVVYALLCGAGVLHDRGLGGLAAPDGQLDSYSHLDLHCVLRWMVVLFVPA